MKRPWVLRNILFVCVLLLGIPIGVDLLLVSSVDFLPMNLRNIILSGYSTALNGIYFIDPHWKMAIMKPNYGRAMFYNGYKWHHEANSFGIRDDEDFEKADIVLLGDSMIYGHGLNLEDTVSENLEKISGLKVANLGVQADYPVKEYLRLKHLGLYFSPRVVLFFVLSKQDERDFETYLFHSPSPEEYIGSIVSESFPSYSLSVRHSDYLRNYRVAKDTIKNRIKAWSPSFKILEVLIRNISLNEEKANKAVSSTEAQELMRNVMSKLLADSKQLCDARHARFIVVLHGHGETSRLGEIIQDLCTKYDILFFDLNPQLSGHPDYFLPGDGHYTAKGSRQVAGFLYRYLISSGLL